MPSIMGPNVAAVIQHSCHETEDAASKLFRNQTFLHRSSIVTCQWFRSAREYEGRLMRQLFD